MSYFWRMMNVLSLRVPTTTSGLYIFNRESPVETRLLITNQEHPISSDSS